MKILYCNHDLIKYHIAEALVMGGLPMSTDTDNLATDIRAVEASIFGYSEEAILENYAETEAQEAALAKRLAEHMARGSKLGKAKAGSGHDCFLKGIVVTGVVSLPAYMWPQVQRYHFLDIVSSQSKMHRITKMDLKAQCNEEVDDEIIDKLNGWILEYDEKADAIKEAKAQGYVKLAAAAEAENHKLFRKIINNAPHGLHLAAGIVTNYLQLKTMKIQRKPHKLEEWHEDFVAWVDSLPYFTEFTGL